MNAIEQAIEAPTTLNTEVLIVGGGLGGVAAALSALEAGKSVVVTEQYDWLGGQLTSQAVPLDEHTWVEQFGVTASYRRLRDGIRKYYRDWYPLTAKARADPHLNPGVGMVSAICAEPRVAVAVIDGLLAPYYSSGRLKVLKPFVPVAAKVDGTRIQSVTVLNRRSQQNVEINALFFLDATELGDLLPLTGVEYTTGAESRERTGEPSAPQLDQPDNQQAISWCFVMDYTDDDHTITRPRDYEWWRALELPFWGAPMLSLTGPDPRTLEPLTRTFNPNAETTGVADQRADAGDRELWTFRRLLAKSQFEPGAFESDIVLANWPMIDYVGGTVVDNLHAKEHSENAKRLALSMFYWLQTEAPRPDGGKGWPGLRLRGDVTGTDDGFAQAPYIRESRRIHALRTVVESDLSIELRGNSRPATFPDTVGIGMYRIDLHPTTGGDNYHDVPSVPFEIPLGALIPLRMTNFLPAGKNIGTTHITNGAFRLHPVEWNIGEAAGALAAYCINLHVEPQAVHSDAGHLAALQGHLVDRGVELHWPSVEGY